MVEGDRRGQSVAHAECEAVDGRTRHDEGFDREDDIALFIDVGLTDLLVEVRLSAGLVEEGFVHVIEGCTLKSGTYEEELRVILTVVEAAEDAFVLIDDTDLVVALGAITFLGECF